MGAKFRSWWQYIRKHWIVTIIIALALLFALIICAGYIFNWDWAGMNEYNKITISTDITSTPHKIIRTEDFQPGKTLWDWLQLLFIPAFLTLGAVWFTSRQNHDIEIASQQHENDRQITVDNQREAALQAYIDRMSELLVKEHLRESAPIDEVRTIATVRTITLLGNLDPNRKRSVIKFLLESGLINKDLGIIQLREADLSGAHLNKARLAKVDLKYTDLSKVNLVEADLNQADLAFANLSQANLSKASLDGANLAEAFLYGANLVSAFLEKANLNGANLSTANLSGAVLYEADLNGALLDGTNLSNANLSKTNLHDAVLYEADLNGANLTGANLSTAIVTTEQLAQAKSLKGATMPDGSIHPYS